MRKNQLKGSKWSVGQRDKHSQCVVSAANPRGRITTVSRVRHYNNGHEIGYTEDTNARCVRQSPDHAWFESINVEKLHDKSKG